MAGLRTEGSAPIEDRISRIENEGPRIRAILVLAAALAILWGCIAFPTPEHGGPYIAEETFRSLEAGKTRRTEVLAQFGDPSERLQDDRFFIYFWERIAGYWFVGGPGGGAGGAWARGHHLCFEFNPNGTLKRFVHLEGVWSGDLRMRLEAWMAEP